MEAEREAVSALLSFLRRNKRLIGATTLIGTSIFTVFVSFGLTPQYLATTTVLVDSRKTQLIKDQEVIGRPGTENSAIESEAEMLASPPRSPPGRRTAPPRPGQGIHQRAGCTVMNRVQDDFARSYPEYGSFYKVA